MTPTWPHRSHHHRPLTASHEAKAIDRVPVNGHLSQRLPAAAHIHIICVLFLHHMAAGEGRWEQKKTQRQLSLRAAARDVTRVLAMAPGEFTHICFLHPLAPAEGMTDAYSHWRKNSLQRRSHLSIGPGPTEDMGAMEPDIRVCPFLKILGLRRA